MSNGKGGMRRPDDRPRESRASGGTQRPPARTEGADEARICGANACEAVWRKRPQDIVRVYLNRARMAMFAEMLSWCAGKRIAYHLVTNEELAKVTGSQHHEGICLLVRETPPLSFEQLCSRVAARTGPVCLLLLDDIGNPHNVGAIMRVAAHFGVAGIVWTSSRGEHLSRSTALYRTAEGGMEHVPLVSVDQPVTALHRLRQCSVEAVATSSHATLSAAAVHLPARCILLLGSESSGLRQELLNEAVATVGISGTGWVESLNVACATTALLALYRGKHPVAKTAAV